LVSSTADLSVSFICGFFLAVVTTIVARIRRRTAGHVLVRVGAAVVLGAIAAAVAAPHTRMGGYAAYLLILGPSLLVWPWGAPPDPPREAGAQAGRGLAWTLPFALAFGQALGSSVGFAAAAGSALERDPAGSMLALLIFSTAVGTLVVSTATVAFFALIRRPAPERLAFRAGLGVLIGGLNGAFAWILRTSEFSFVGGLALILAAIVLSVPWPVARGRPASV
jgi:hypothetical protein